MDFLHLKIVIIKFHRSWNQSSHFVITLYLPHHYFQAVVETVTYTPFAMTSFYFGMSILENKTVDEAANEVRTKFWPTYKVKNVKCLSRTVHLLIF